MRRILAFCGIGLVTAGLMAASAPSSIAAAPRSVMYVGNNWDGTVDIVDPVTLQVLKRINIIPDRAQRNLEILLNPVAGAFFLAIRSQIGQGHDQFTDDMFSTTDGKLLAVSRPSYADVVGVNLTTGQIVWRAKMDSYRADHMALSPDGNRILVSDSLANKVHEINIHTGAKLRTFPSGDSPHESNYSPDGSLIYHASIGRIYTPTDPSIFCPLADPTKGAQYFQIVNNANFAILKRWDIGKKLAEAGYPCMSSAVRPMAIAPDQRYAYLQLSFFHGYVVFDMQTEQIVQVVNLPNLVPTLPKAKYILNSAHHGLAMNAAGTRLCAAGTMDNYIAIIDRATTAAAILGAGQLHVPYWATNDPTGTKCWVSIAADNKVAVVDYATAQVVGIVNVGRHPQRIRAGVIDSALVP